MEISIAFGAAAFAMAAYLHKSGRPFGKVLLFLYFGAMEALQIGQHFVLGDCANIVNRTLTGLAWVHIAFQPLVVNSYLMANTNDVHPDVALLVKRLCLIVGFGMTARLPFPGNPVAALGDLLNGGAAPAPGAAYDPGHPLARFPELPPSAAGGTACGMEGLCGRSLCAFQGTRHLAWSVPLLPANYILPNGWAHALLFFGPTLLAPGKFAGIRRVIAVGSWLIGPLASMLISRGAAYQFEWAAVWCLMSAGQAFGILAADVYEEAVRRRRAARKARRAAAEKAALAGAPSTSAAAGVPVAIDEGAAAAKAA
jgi:hypothetical protein